MNKSKILFNIYSTRYIYVEKAEIDYLLYRNNYNK